MIHYVAPSSLDQAVLADIRALGGAGENILADVKNLFVEDTANQLARLTDALRTGVTEAVWQVAHRLKGSALAIGASQLAKICAGVEDAARAGELGRAAIGARALIREFAEVSAALTREVGQ
jgi:HPt (histidine-containing phosphotransfer) domain-containing protein